VKRRALLQHLRRHGCYLKREGKAHSLWCNPANGAIEAVPRHTEISNQFGAKNLSRFRYSGNRLNSTWPANKLRILAARVFQPRQQIKDSCRARFSAAAKSGVELNPRDDVEVWDFNATLLGVRWNQGGLKFWIGVDGQRTGNESERIRVDKFRKGLGTRQGNTRVDERAMSSARMGASFGRARG